MKRSLVTLAMACIASSAVAAPPPAARIGVIKAQLFYEQTGRFGPDLLSQPDLSLWNTIIAGGAAEEYANDLFVSAEVLTRGQQNVSTPLRLTATGAKGRVIADRRINDILTSESGHAWKGILLRDIGCEGPVTITVAFGTQRMTRKLDFQCGE